MGEPAPRREILSFGPFSLVVSERLLMRDGDPVGLGGRTLDMLIALVSRPNEIVLKRDLLAQVWPDVTVEEISLRFHIARLREALGDRVNGARYIITVPGRGYCFVAPISRSADRGGKLGTGASAFPNSGFPRMVGHADDIAADRGLMRTASGHGYQFTGDVCTQPAGSDESVVSGMVAARPTSTLPPTNLPEPLSELIGRENEIGEILNLAAAHRLVTLTGPGGIGKTSVALALARELRPNFADGVWLAEFSPLTDPGLVPATVVAAAGIELGGEISVQRVAQALAGRRLLLVLDTCEHVIGVAAALAEAILRAGPASRIIATSREPLRVEGEWIYGIPPLAVPAENPTDDALQYGAVQLFVSRARAAEPHFVLNRRIAGTISAICRRLDGIPLAVELAAARAAALDIGELAVRLSDRFSLLTRGRRTALPRHQTLRATLDWSYELLSEPERILLRRLAIFAGPFSLEAASAVAGGAGTRQFGSDRTPFGLDSEIAHCGREQERCCSLLAA